MSKYDWYRPLIMGDLWDKCTEKEKLFHIRFDLAVFLIATALYWIFR